MSCAHQMSGFHKMHTRGESVAVHRYNLFKVTIKYMCNVVMIIDMFGEERNATNLKAVSCGHMQTNTDIRVHKMTELSTTFSLLYTVE